MAALCDAVSTIYVMLNEGPETEIHPAIMIVSKIVGPVAGPLVGLVGKTIAIMIVTVYCKKIARPVILLAAVLSLFAAWYNLWGYEVLNPAVFSFIPW